MPALKLLRQLVLSSFVLGTSLATSPAQSQCPSGSEEFMTGAVGAIVPIGPTGPCTDPLVLPAVWSFWSNPDVFVNGNGILTWSAQANRAVSGSCTGETGIDRWFSATYNPVTNTWTPPAASACADLQGSYSRAPYSPANHGPLGDSDIIKVGSKYYMAFNGGNADFIVGQVYWATSSTGLPGSWNIYNATGSQPWIPLIRDRYHDGRDGIPEPLGTFPWRIPGGFTETYLAYDPAPSAAAPSGYFYLYLGHYGLRQEEDADGLPPLDRALYEIDSWAVRIPYDPSNTYGLSSQKEIWHLGGWSEFDSGQLVWDFDPAGNPVPLEPIVKFREGQNGVNRFFPGGGGALRQDQVTGQWLHIYWFTAPTDAYSSQRATSLADNYWTEPVPICRDTLQDLVPPGTTPDPDIYEPGLHFGAMGNRTGWWIFSPVNFLGCASAYIGAGIVPAELCTTALPTISVVSLGSGTDGSALTITGTGLDCVSSVTFGGATAAIQARAGGLLNVTAPDHSPGPVSVVVTTPSGSATKSSGFTYLPRVTIAATDNSAAESPFNTGKFTLTRTGATTSALTVTVTIGGDAPTAINGTDYLSISTSQIIGAGQASKIITVSPVNDSAVEPVENVKLTVAAGAGYAVGSASNATVAISSEDVGATVPVSITATDPTAAESPADSGKFKLTRTGSTASALTVTVAFGGTASMGPDYAAISSIQTIPAGALFTEFGVSPVNDSLLEASETVVATVTAPPGSPYTVGSPSTATVTIASEDPPCAPSSTTLCLVDGRFAATLTATTADGQPRTGKAVTYPASNKAGWFWLFTSQMPEEGLTILDNGLGGFKVTYGASTDSATALTVTDLATGVSHGYGKALGTYCGASVAQAFSLELPSDFDTPEAAPPIVESFTCTPDSVTACLLGNRFQVRVKVGGVAKPVTTITGQSASYRLTTASEPDIWVNLFDGTTLNGKYWVYYGSLTSQTYSVEVKDSASATNATKTYPPNGTNVSWCGGGDNQAF